MRSSKALPVRLLLLSLTAGLVLATSPAPAASPQPANELVSRFTTHFPPGQPRVINIRRAAQLLDRTVLQPGTRFSMNQAAVPSLHFGYALLVGVTVAVLARRGWVRVLGGLYPAVMLLVIVATGNHFFFDAAAGALAIGAGFLLARLLDTNRRELRTHPSNDPAQLPA